jgi:hypothetical protein
LITTTDGSECENNNGVDGESENNCIWLKMKDNTYSCLEKEDESLDCSEVSKDECSDTILSGTSLEGKCVIYKETCKTRCSLITTTDGSECENKNGVDGESENNCIWLKMKDNTYSCLEKEDESLSEQR